MKKLGFIDRFLTIWIFLAMIVGIVISILFGKNIEHFNIMLTIGKTNILLAVGLILMMYPPLAKVDYSCILNITKDSKSIWLSLLMNWIFGPFLMFFLALFFLHDYPQLMSGVIMIGIARCIAMVLVWNDIGGGDKEYGASLVALNSIFQILTYSFMAYIFITKMPTYFGYRGEVIDIQPIMIFKNTFIYLFIPFIMGYFSRVILVKVKGIGWYTEKFIPMISPITLIALLFTIIYMFSLKGSSIFILPKETLLVATPLIIYFIIMFFSSYFIGKSLSIPFEKRVSIAYTATGNNFELAIAVAIGVFGIGSPQAFAGIIGPLVEVPILILLVKVALKFKKRDLFKV